MSETILIVDDEKVIRDLTAMLLTARGYVVSTASSGPAAMKSVAETAPALVLLDYMMPGMDGMQALKELRQISPHSYVVMFTGKGSEDLAVDVMKAGAYDYIRKPFNNQDLVDRIEKVFRLRRIELRNLDLLAEREHLLAEIADWNRELEKRVKLKTAELEAVQGEIIQAEKLGALGHLSAGLTHEIRNPLNSIGLFAQVLNQSRLDKDVAAYPEKIIDEIERIDQLLIRLLKVSEKSFGERVNVSISQVIQKALAMFSAQIEVQGVDLKVSLCTEACPIQTDADEIIQIFTNLFSNALQAMPDGGELFVGLEQNRSQLEIRIADTGNGIPVENLNQIFDPFFTTRKKGTGFGLSTVLRIVKSNDGRISVVNRPEGGAEFTITLPISRTSLA
jgi:signal transduction histidine kinase